MVSVHSHHTVLSEMVFPSYSHVFLCTLVHHISSLGLVSDIQETAIQKVYFQCILWNPVLLVAPTSLFQHRGVMTSLPPCRVSLPRPPGPHRAHWCPITLVCVLCHGLWRFPGLQLWAWC